MATTSGSAGFPVGHLHCRPLHFSLHPQMHLGYSPVAIGIPQRRGLEGPLLVTTDMRCGDRYIPGPVLSQTDAVHGPQLVQLGCSLHDFQASRIWSDQQVASCLMYWCSWLSSRRCRQVCFLAGETGVGGIQQHRSGIHQPTGGNAVHDAHEPDVCSVHVVLSLGVTLVQGSPHPRQAQQICGPSFPVLSDCQHRVDTPPTSDTDSSPVDGLGGNQC